MGGGVIRTAAKAVASGPFRSTLLDEGGRRSVRQQLYSFVPAVEPELLVPTISVGHGRTEAPAVAVAARWPVLEFDEWELTGRREESFESVGNSPRLIFGPVPSIEEARDATADLKHALEKVYFKPQHTLESNGVCQATASGECGTVSAAPGSVTQMFSFLQGSPKLQGVVASLASDENVWNAVMKNDKLVQYFDNTSPDTLSAVNTQIYEEPAESVAENKAPDVFSPTVEVKETSEGSLVNKVKVKVSQLVNDISDSVKGFLGISSTESSFSSEVPESSVFDGTNMAFKASFLALAVAAILILFKRG